MVQLHALMSALAYQVTALAAVRAGELDTCAGRFGGSRRAASSVSYSPLGRTTGKRQSGR